MPAYPSPALQRLVLSNLAAQSAEQISLAALPMVAVLALGAGAAEIGLLAAAQSLPFLLASIPLGLLADRLPRRRVMLACELLRMLSLAALLAGWLTGTLSLAGMAVLGFLGAVGTVGYSVAAPALVPHLVERAALARANGRLELARSAAFAAGPAVAGALVAWAGAGAAFVLAAVLSGAAVGWLWRLREPPRSPAPARRVREELAEGLHQAWRQPLLRPMLLTALAWNLSWFVLQAAYVPYAMRGMGLGPGAVGATLAAYGAGMVAGALATPRLLAGLPFGRAVQLGPLVSVVAAAAMAATLWRPGAALALLSFLLFGAGPMVWTITSTTLRQAVTPAERLGRVSAVFLTANAGARPLGALLGGWVGAHWGEAACLLLALAGFILQAGIVLASPLGALRRLPAAG
ncbi:MFS transporter [Ramlibacter tataouinensis]|uniref:Candidate transporter n=1 Tax=Ramlibacter tataouinensis (strain ATCC BAA-407 / DSM 14655 / LMG 21543 / TTB310) TaxID=365046 RepID=F5Y5D3_RAMTT|nr:MFS transporter [Ramlibacter tataouinensis]AEG91443.1 Candidate transporter [Ramlibacter tataouinensis TTB310]